MAGIRQSRAWGLFCIPWGIFSACLTAFVILLAAPFKGPRRAFFDIAPWWSRQMFRLCGVRLTVEGWEALPEDIREGRQSVILMGNHESLLDPPVLMGAIPIPAVYISKREVLWLPLVGWAAACAGTIFIDRGNRERSVASLRRAARQIHDGKNVVIFPEGTRTRDGRLGPFKKGGFNLAQNAGVPIVPFAIAGAFEILPPHSFRVRPGHYRVRFGMPVDTAAHPDRERLLEEVQGRVAALRESLGAVDARSAKPDAP